MHYFYAPEDVSPDYGEIYGKGDFNVTDFLTLGGRVFFAPDYNQSGKTATLVAGGANQSSARYFGLWRRRISVL